MSKERQDSAVKVAGGLILLAVAGAAGGSIAGFRVEPEECAQARVKLAACEARDEVVSEALDKAESALLKAYSECRP